MRGCGALTKASEAGPSTLAVAEGMDLTWVLDLSHIRALGRESPKARGWPLRILTSDRKKIPGISRGTCDRVEHWSDGEDINSE